MDTLPRAAQTIRGRFGVNAHNLDQAGVDPTRLLPSGGFQHSEAARVGGCARLLLGCLGRFTPHGLLGAGLNEFRSAPRNVPQARPFGEITVSEVGEAVKLAGGASPTIGQLARSAKAI